MGDMGLLIFGVYAAVIFFTVSCAIKRSRDDAELRKLHPEIWIRKKELDAGEKQRKHERTSAGLKVGGFLGRLILGKYLK